MKGLNMPSVQQIKKTNDLTPNQAKLMPRLLKYTAIALALVLLFRHFFVPETGEISHDMWGQKDSDFYSAVVGKKKIVWFGADCPVSAARRKAINEALKRTGLDKFYEQKAFLQNSLMTKCSNHDCLDVFLIENCSENYCIIIPSQRKYIKIGYNSLSLISDLEKMKNW